MSTPPPPENQGSLGLGIALAWACLIAGYTVAGIFASIIFRGPSTDAQVGLAILAALMPWLLMIGLIVMFATRGQSRTAIGVAVGIGSILGVVLLLVAACFGLFAMK